MTDENQLDERIRASLTRRAEAVQVEPDLDGLAARAGSHRSGHQRFPLVAVAVVIAALAATSALASPLSGPMSHVISLSGNQHEPADDPTTTTSGASEASSTSRPGPSRMSTTTTTPGTGPTTTVESPGDATPSTEPGESPGDGTGATPEPEPDAGDGSEPGNGGPPPDCVRLGGGWMDRVAWSLGSYLALVDVGPMTDSTRGIALYMPVGAPGDDDCYRRITVTNQDGTTAAALEVSSTANSETEIHTLGCQNPVLRVADVSTTDGVMWTFRVREIEVMGFMARTTTDAAYTAEGEAWYLDYLRRLDCDDSTPL